jgi:hypothetical protein
MFTSYASNFAGVKRPKRGLNKLPSSTEVKERVKLYVYPTLCLHGRVQDELKLFFYRHEHRSHLGNSHGRELVFLMAGNQNYEDGLTCSNITLVNMSLSTLKRKRDILYINL